MSTTPFLSLARAGRFGRTLAGGALIGGLCLTSTAQAAITFSFDYSSNTAGVGFLDPTFGPARQTALTTAGTMFSDLFGTSFSNSANLTIAVSSLSDPLSGTLASAGSELTNAQGFGNSEVVRNKLLSNGAIDLNNAANDGSVNVNFGWVWQLNPNVPANAGANEFDFYAAMFHELTHAIGFSNTVGQFGKDLFGNGTSLADNGSGITGSFAKYDQFLSACGGARLINQASAITNSAAGFGATATSGSGLCFDGANAKAANGGTGVQLYAPGTFSDGSSIAHLDKAVFPAAMMKHDRDFGPEARIYSAVEVGVLLDLGYSAVTPIPEPTTWAMMLAGLGGLAAWRRKRA